MPLNRAGSIEQTYLRDFFERLSSGSWCHIFPEGKIFQNWRFAVENNTPVLGPLKLGVGKVIAHSEVCPVVIPIYHRGLDSVLPENVLELPPLNIVSNLYHRNKKVENIEELIAVARKDRRQRIPPSSPVSPFPSKRHPISVLIGEPLDFSSELKEFRSTYPGLLDTWKTSLPAIALYERITIRIQSALLELEREAYR